MDDGNIGGLIVFVCLLVGFLIFVAWMLRPKADAPGASDGLEDIPEFTPAEEAPAVTGETTAIERIKSADDPKRTTCLVCKHRNKTLGCGAPIETRRGRAMRCRCSHAFHDKPARKRTTKRA